MPRIEERPPAATVHRRTRARSRAGAENGQAAVELVAILPFLAALLAALWQLSLAGHAAWAAATAARAAARADAVGADPRRAALDHLPRPLERGLHVRTMTAGEVRVEVRIPTLPGLPNLGHTHATARFAPR
jgi:TadE-like protein